jgi:hypothetical protein
MLGAHQGQAYGRVLQSSADPLSDHENKGGQEHRQQGLGNAF